MSEALQLLATFAGLVSMVGSGIATIVTLQIRNEISQARLDFVESMVELEQRINDRFVPRTELPGVLQRLTLLEERRR